MYPGAIRHAVELQEQQFTAVVAGDTESSSFDILIHEANEKKLNAKYAYLNHLHVHGCSMALSVPLRAKSAG